jgi:hypothetical protein
MRRVLWMIVFLSAIFATAQVTESDNRASQKNTAKRPLPDVVASILEDAGRSGSLAYSWKCVASRNFHDPVRAPIPPEEGTVIQRLRTAFANIPWLRVTVDPSGFVRVVGGPFKTDLLDLKIKRIVFHSQEDPMLAFADIMDSPEIDAYATANNITLVPTFGGLYAAPSKSSPRLDGTRDNIKLSEALDLLPVTYSGLWVYKECKGPGEKRLVTLEYFQWSVPWRFKNNP